jgi:threonine dehydrogenase-like Zn-dependent dehydrogenase
MGNCNHRSVIPDLVIIVQSGSFDPLGVLTNREPLMNVIDAYTVFDKRQPGWLKVKLDV